MQPASTLVSAMETGAATGSAWAGTDPFPTAPAETLSMHNNTASQIAEAGIVHSSEANRLEPVRTGTAAVGIDAAAMQRAVQEAAAGTDIGAGANTSVMPVSASTPEP